jgi:peroxiredoxin
LYRDFGDKGLVVVAISTEERAVVAKFVADKGYSFPILLDPGGKASADFDVDGIPRSFLFDRQGSLVAEAIDRRTESQFRSMLKAAGLE